MQPEAYTAPPAADKPPAALVTIEVRYGIAEITACPPGIEVQIVDYDGGSQGAPCTIVAGPFAFENDAAELARVLDEISFLKQRAAAILAS